MASFTCLVCCTEAPGPYLPSTWTTLLVEVANVGSRTTAKMRRMNFCEGCECIGKRFITEMCACSCEPADTTADERPVPVPVAPLARGTGS